MHHEQELIGLPKKDKRFSVTITCEPGDGRAMVYNPESCELEAATEEVTVSVDPSEFLDYVTGAELVKAAKMDGLFDYASDGEKGELLTILGGIDEYAVLDLLGEIGDALREGRTADAMLAIDRYEAPKWASEADCKAAYDAAMASQ